jgi:AcrR family transcriptional regulator
MYRKVVAVPARRRELNKQDKLRRITHDARTLFIANDYDEASTRQIAVKAAVAIGTVFLYAADKRDLLFLVVNDELEEVASKAVAAIRSDVPLIENLIAAFPLYEFFGKEPRLSRPTLREMMFNESGLRAKHFIRIRYKMIDLCKKWCGLRNEETRSELATAIGRLEKSFSTSIRSKLENGWPRHVS